MTQPIPTQPAEPEATAYCCELAQFGDCCDCAADLAELAAAFAHPIHWPAPTTVHTGVAL